MNASDLAWIGPLKEAVLLMYFVIFCGILAYVFLNKEPEDKLIPFRFEGVAGQDPLKECQG